MADLYMHAKFALDLANFSSSPFDKNAVLLGAQYTDPLYYIVFGKEKERYRNYANKTHDTNTKLFLSSMVDYVKQHPSLLTTSFLIGITAHYVLDVFIHPYVYHHVGIYSSTNKNTFHMRGLHLKFERSIDAALYEKDHHKNIRFLKLTRETFPIKKVPTEINNLMNDAFQKSFHIDDGGVIYSRSIKSAYFVLKYLSTDRYGIKRKIYSYIDKIYKSEDLFLEDLSFYRSTKDFDYLNIEKRTWNHPLTNQSFNTSVLEIYEEALIYANHLLKKIELYLQDGKIDLSEIFTNLSLNSGIDCKTDKPFQHFNIYRPQNDL
jgi:hypothetical protein